MPSCRTRVCERGLQWMAASLFFGYTFVFTASFFLLTGTVGYFSCQWFINVIYSSIKVRLVALASVACTSSVEKKAEIYGVRTASIFFFFLVWGHGMCFPPLLMSQSAFFSFPSPMNKSTFVCRLETAYIPLRQRYFAKRRALTLLVPFSPRTLCATSVFAAVP